MSENDNAAGREAMNDKRLEQLAGLAELPCSCDNTDCQNFMSALTAHQAQELAAEARRARAALAAATARAEQAEARLAELGEPATEYGQKYRGGGYLTRVDSDWMRERWPVEQWTWDNTRHGSVVGKRTIIVVEDWQDIRAADLPEQRPADDTAATDTGKAQR